jgi:hypothetical protein
VVDIPTSRFAATRKMANLAREAGTEQRSRRAVVVVTAAVLTIVSLPFDSITAHEGVDQSWKVAISLAHVQGLRFGRDLFFTYGPLGYLSNPSEAYYPGVVLGLVYCTVTIGILYGALCTALRRWMPMPAAIAITAIFSLPAASINTPELGAIAATVFGVGLLHPSKVDEPLAPWIPIVLGSLAALELCVKFSVGTFFILVTAALVLARPGRRRTIPLAALSFVTALVVLWVLSGQRLGDLVPWLRSSSRIAAGYSDAMAIPGVDDIHWLGWALLAVPAALLVAWAATRLLRDGRKYVPVVAFTGLVFWFFTKQGFVRLDPHRDVTFVALAALIATVGWWSWERVLALAVAGFCLCTVLIGQLPWRSKVYKLAVQHIEAPKEVWQVARLLTDSDKRRATEARDREKILNAYYVDAPVLDRVRGTVHVDPWDVAAVWAAGLEWHPTPVFQTYFGFDSGVDHSNAEALRGDHAPDTILRIPGKAIDRRVPIWESPEYQVAMTCNYDYVVTAGPWEVLYASKRDRCGEPVLLDEQTLAQGQTGVVPRPQSPTSLVAVRFDYPVSRLHALITTALKPLDLSAVRVDRNDNRFIAAVAGQPHLVHVPVDNGTVPNAGLDIRSIEFPNADGPVVARYYEIPVS